MISISVNRRLNFVIAGLTLPLLAACGSGEYHCRIENALDYNTGRPVQLPSISEFTVRPETTTNIYRAGVAVGLAYSGGLDGSSGERLEPFVVFSKLDGKFDEMYLYYDGGAHVAGFCAKVSMF